LTSGAVDAFADIPESSERARSILFHPLVVGCVLAVVCSPLSSTLPAAGLDPSWQLGLSLGAARSLTAGESILFTYGPFGFVAAPNLVWLPGVLLGITYALGAAVALYSLVYRAAGRWLPPLAALAAVTLIAIITAAVRPVPEMVALASALWALSVVDARHFGRRIRPWVPAAFGAIAGTQLLVKFSVGTLAIGLAAVVALARPRRTVNALSAAAGFLVTIAALWTSLGQPISAFWPWMRGAFDVASGYSAAMAVEGETSATRSWLFALATIGIVVLGCCVLASRQRLRAVPSVVVLVATGWFLLKAGFVRLDAGHAAVTFLGLGVLALAVPWPRHLRVLGIAGAALALAGTMIAVPTSTGAPFGGTAELARSLHAVVYPSYRTARLAEARSGLRAMYALPRRVEAALEGHIVHAEPWDIAAVWAYDLSWQPLPVFQTYSAYTTHLDDLNRDRLRAHPRVTILRRADRSLDQRVPAWESPNAMVAMTCSYEIAVSVDGWEALIPRSDQCAEPRPLQTVRVEPGQTITTPAPSEPTSIVVAAFLLADSPLTQLTSTALKPQHVAMVLVDSRPTRLVTGTASAAHLVTVPDTVAGTVPANAGLEIRRLAFRGIDGPVTVRFSEIPIR